MYVLKGKKNGYNWTQFYKNYLVIQDILECIGHTAGYYDRCERLIGKYVKESGVS